MGIFDGPDIRKDLIVKDPHVELRVWTSFKSVIQNFLGNRQANNYRQQVDELIQNYREPGTIISIKMHFLHSHLDNCSKNCGEISDEQGEKFHQDIKLMEERYQRCWDNRMNADCWSLKKQKSYQHHSRK